MRTDIHLSGPPESPFHSGRVFGMVGLIFGVMLLLFVPSASASYEQVAIRSSGVGGTVALNLTGAGGVAPGTLYEAGGPVVARVSPDGNLLGTWATPGTSKGVAVDQATGNVYVLESRIEEEAKEVTVYSPDGSNVLTTFGEYASFETFDQSPGKIHITPEFGGIAVDSSGAVYVSDANRSVAGSRVMVFEPESPGDYHHYVYAGRPHDLSYPIDNIAGILAVDSEGNLYTANPYGAIYEFDPQDPLAPVCEYQDPRGGLGGMTVDPATGGIFYFTANTPTKAYRLSPCQPDGKFVQAEEISLGFKVGSNYLGLAFNPNLAYQPSRSPGILYLGQAIFAPAESRFPLVESESVSSVTSTTAGLGSQINPRGSLASYVFQYLTDDQYETNDPGDRFAGAREAPLGGAVLGSGQSALAAAASLTGLQPDTEYHYRAVATSHCEPDHPEAICEETGEGQSFRTYPDDAPGLSDGRVWELVSPPQKNGGEVFPANPNVASCHTVSSCKPGWNGPSHHFPMQSAPGGDAVVYMGSPFSPTEGAAQFNEYLSTRSGSGWQTTVLSPQTHTGSYSYFDTNLTQGVLDQFSSAPPLSPEAPAGRSNLYAQPTTSPSSFTPFLRAEPTDRNPRLSFVGASADFSRLFFEADDALTDATPAAPPAVDGGEKENNLYELTGGQLRLVNVDPGNAATTPGAAFGARSVSTNIVANLTNAISGDGTRVFWTSQAGGLYVRIDAKSTQEIPDPGAKFVAAAQDGSRVLLGDGELFQVDDLAASPVDLSQGKGGFQGISGQSDDLSHLYFIDTAVLSGDEVNEYGDSAEEGGYNLYAWREGETTFLGTLDDFDELSSESGGGGDWAPSPVQRFAEASPDGRWLVFRSVAPLTGYVENCPTFDQSITVEAPCEEVFLYDYATGKLRCVSCNSSGARPLGQSRVPTIFKAQSSQSQPRYLTNSGRLYFDTGESLSPFDTNNGVEDVYQYEPDGIGSCRRTGGCVNLISAGHEPVDSNFLAVDATGKNVFFTTRDQLTIKDRDDLIDLYVAREGGGPGSETEDSRGECQGEACVPALAPPSDPTPGSSSFQGAGNVVEPPPAKCPKGKVKKKGKCVKKHKSKKHHSHKRAGHKGGVPK